MKKELIFDDIAYVSETGHIIYFDYVHGYTENSILYAGQYITDISPEKLKIIKEKKNNYELLKLSTSKSELQNLISEQAKEIINNVFLSEIKKELENYKSEARSLSESIKNTVNALNTLIMDSRNVSDKSYSIEKELNKLKDSDFVSTIENTLLSNKQRVDTAVQCFNKINSKLEELFK